MANSVEIPKEATPKVDGESGEQKYSVNMRRYMIFLAIVQGFAVMLNLNVVFMLSGTAAKALDVEPFSGIIVFILEVVGCTVNTLLFWMNPVKPWLTVVVTYVQAFVYVYQILVIRLMSGNSGKVMYLIGTAVCGAVFGWNSMTSFGFVAFGPINHLGSLSFGFALGGVVPFIFSTAIQFTLFADDTVESLKAMMYSLMGFVSILSAVAAVNLTLYLNNKEIKQHYAQIELDGITAVKCTFRAAARGLKYTWKIVAVDFVNYIDLLAFFPSVFPFSLKTELKYKIMLVGVSQVCDTIGRGIAVFVKPKYLLFNTLDRVMVLAVCNIGTSVFLMCSIFFHETFMGNLAVITCVFIVRGMAGGYCASYADKAIGEHVPKHLDNDTVVSTTSVFKIIVSIFCAVGSLIAALIVPLFADAPDAKEKAAKVVEAVVERASS